MFCPACGTPRGENARYCQSWGAVLTASPAASPPPGAAGLQPTAAEPEAAGQKTVARVTHRNAQLIWGANHYHREKAE